MDTDLRALEERLQFLGLTDKEARTYLGLLQYGTRPTSYIAGRMRLNRGTTYVALHSLLEKGLVVKSTKRGVQYFTALEPEHLTHYLERKVEEVRLQRQKAEELIAPLGALLNPLTTRPQIEYFEGIEGARTALEGTLRAKTKPLRSFLSVVDIADFIGHEFFEAYTNRRIAAKLPLRVIRTLEKDREAEKTNIFAKRYRTEKKELRDVRYVPDDLAFPISMYLYDDKVLMVSSKEENFALTITSGEFCAMQQKLFELLWKTAKNRS